MSSIVPLNVIKKFHNDRVSSKDMHMLLNRAVRREVSTRCIEIIAKKDEELKKKLEKEIDSFTVDFIVTCKDANIFPEKKTTFDIAAGLQMLKYGISRIGDDEDEDEAFNLICQITHADDDLWIEMGFIFMKHDTAAGIQLLLKKKDEIKRLSDEYERVSELDITEEYKNSLMKKLKELTRSYVFFAIP